MLIPPEPNMLTLSQEDIRGLKAILNWGPKNFHLLTEDNKVKLWLKVYDKVQPDKVDVQISLSEAVKQARTRALAHLV